MSLKRLQISPNSALAMVLTAGFALGLLIISETVYVLMWGGWTLHEDGRLAHGLYRRLTGIVVLAHTASFYLFGLKARRPRWRIVPLYLLSLVFVLVGSLLAFDMAWKSREAGEYIVSAWPLVLAIGIAIASIATGTTRSVARS